MKLKAEIQKRFGLTISLVLFVFSLMTAAMLLAGIVVILLHRVGVLSVWNDMPDRGTDVAPLRFIVQMIGSSIVLGTAFAAFFSKRALKPIRTVIDATHLIAEGDFSARVDIRGIYELVELSNSFNKMAHELSSIETLRSDFINNFSHEFKTPIVSVRGFAKLLKSNHLTEDEKQEYLDIIIAESERLAQLSTNILNLSKYENIEIVTDKAPFRLDEQIRCAVVMMEPKWATRGISININMGEIVFNGNEDLTQQIWLNLLDNAIKYSNDGGIIQVRLSGTDGLIHFTIADNGDGMDEEIKDRIFDKFYQGDTSHAKSGNGLGLAIVKRITELHGGSIEVNSEVGKGSTFLISLPDTSSTIRPFAIA